jgi:hypothetical protein
MGNWRITIEGVGIHENGRYDDADAIGRRTVKALGLAGQGVSYAVFSVVEKRESVAEDGTKHGSLLQTDCDLTMWHPSLDSGEHIEQFFAYDHLPPHLKSVSAPFAEMANFILATLPRNPERTVALRKLLEAKDAAVRAKIAKEPPSAGTKEPTK